jgi:hypothetical protein
VAFIEEHTTLQHVLDELKTIAGRYSPASFISHHVEWDAAVVHAAEQECGTQTGLPGLPRVCTMLASADKYGGGHFLKLGELYHALFGEDFEHPYDARARFPPRHSILNSGGPGIPLNPIRGRPGPGTIPSLIEGILPSARVDAIRSQLNCTYSETAVTGQGRAAVAPVFLRSCAV